MTFQRHWTVPVSRGPYRAAVVGGVLVLGWLCDTSPGGKRDEHHSHFLLNTFTWKRKKSRSRKLPKPSSGSLVSSTPDVAAERQTEGGDTQAARAKIEAMAGPSGFMLFGTQDHGSLLRLAGQKQKAVQYVVGNPLFALQMTQHDIRASLYAPLRVLIYEDGQGRRAWSTTGRPRCSASSGTTGSPPPPPCSTGSWRRWWWSPSSDPGRPMPCQRQDGRRRPEGRPRPHPRRPDLGLRERRRGTAPRRRRDDGRATACHARSPASGVRSKWSATSPTASSSSPTASSATWRRTGRSCWVRTAPATRSRCATRTTTWNEELDLVAVTRRQTARTLRLVAPDAWQRTAVHSETGLVTLRQLLLHAINHLRHHLRFVAEKRAAMTVP